MNDPNAEIELQCARLIDYAAAVMNAESDKSLGELHMLLLNSIDNQMSLRYGEDKEISSVESDFSVLHITDVSTGRVFKRDLPMDYRENDNGISIGGENIRGEPVSIAFISETAVGKIAELTGQSDGKPRHDHHNM